MKKVFSVCFLLAIFALRIEASQNDPYEDLKKKREILENLSACEQELKNIRFSLVEYYHELENVPPNVIKLDPFCGDGIQQILKDVQKIRKTDSDGLIVVFFDIDQFTLWKNGFTPVSHLSEIEINNFYEKEDHQSLFRDTEFPNVIKKFKQLNCVLYGLTARYSNLKEYGQNDIWNIRNMCQKLQQLIGFDAFPEEFKYPSLFSHNLSENNNICEPLFGYSGIFLTGKKLKAIQYLSKEGQTFGLFNSEKNPAHIIFGDDSVHNFYGEISENMKCYHWPYPYQVQDELLPFIKLHENKKEAFIHIQHALGARISLGNYAYNLLMLAQDDEKIYADCMKAMLDEVFFDKKDSFIDYMGYTPLHSINTIIDYLKWSHEDHKDIQKSMLNNALVSCIFDVGQDIYQECVNEFFDGNDTDDVLYTISNNIVENQDSIILLGDSPRKIKRQRESLDFKNIDQYRKLYENIWELFEGLVMNDKSDSSEISFNEKETILNSIIKKFICWYAYGDEIETSTDLFEYVKMSFWQNVKLN